MSELLRAKHEGAELAQALCALPGGLAILAEGNTSVRVDKGRFVVKASGFPMSTLEASGMTEVHLDPILEAVLGPDLTDADVRQILLAARNEDDPVPSVETFLHAVLLSLPGVRIIGHTHPPILLSLLCLESAEELASRRLFPDEIVCCGPRACYVPYADPGLPLARAVLAAANAYQFEEGEPPRTIWMQNHGLIALGETSKQVLAATQMQEKAAQVWLGVLGSGRPYRTLDVQQSSRIHRRPDEHHRQRILFQSPA